MSKSQNQEFAEEFKVFTAQTMFRHISTRLFHSTRPALDTLALVESNGNKVSSASLSALEAALQLGKPITAVLLGKDVSIANELSKVGSVSKVITIEGSQFDHLLAEEVCPVVKQVFESDDKLTHFVVPSSTAGKSILPRLGALLDVQPISDIIKVNDETTFVRPIYAGNALATVKSTDSKILLSVRSSAFEPAQSGDNSAAVDSFAPSSAPAGNIELVDQQLTSSERPDLGSASTVISGGRGLKDKETFEKLIEPLAAKLNAAVGALRAAVDSGFCDNSLQVGQTGKIVAPDLYIAVGISGAIQHLAGMKDSKVIVAINKDPDAAIFNVADVGLVGDLNEVIPELTEKL